MAELHPDAQRGEDVVPLVRFLSDALARVRPLPSIDVHLTQSHGHALAADVTAPGPIPAFDHATVDGYAVRFDDVVAATERRPVQLKVLGDVAAASWRPVRILPGTCFAVAAGAPLPTGTEAVVPLSWTDQGMATVEITEVPKRGYGLRRTGDEVTAGAVLGRAGQTVNPHLIALFAASGVSDVHVRPEPRVVIIATGDELMDAGRISQPGQVVDVDSPALTAAAAEAGAHAFRIGICDDEPEALRTVLDDQTLRSDLVITTGGTGIGPGDMVRRTFGRDGAVDFATVSIFPSSTLGFGTIGPEEIPIICLPGEPGAALIAFEAFARPIIRRLAGVEPVFRSQVKAHLLETVSSPAGLREFRPAEVTERRGGGFTVAPLSGGPYTLSGLAVASGLMVLGEKVTNAPAGSTVDVLLFDRRR
ncbi:gephyrin-like molybdotransferase Glp [Phytomonospora sp. NPDC050363]|uniref:molybdopterin molybdotransferase MoeA n=1 Tax=Phytomonospora sp. NPDC050363 TaxID=3155642 RepID=UPI0033E8EA65